MRIVENAYEKEIVLALGLFDSVHLGHTHLLNEARKLANVKGADLAVFTFKNNPFKTFGIDKGLVFTFEERIPLFRYIGIDVIIAKTMDEEYSRISHDEFLESIFTNFKVVGIVCGEDYTFGYNGLGNVENLKEAAKNHGAEVKIVPFLCTETGEKISSNLVRKYLSEGRIVSANQLMGRPYKISGPVVHCFARGREFGFPTANIYVPEDKAKLYEGVYATTVEVDGFAYDSLTSIGVKPTFNDYTVTVESFLLNYSGNLYDKFIDVYFFSKIRDIKKFNSEDEIRAQIGKDIEVAKMVKRTL